MFGNRVHWAKTYLTKAGLLESTRRGHLRVTERGQQVIAAHPPRIDNAFLNQFDEFRQFARKSAEESGASVLPAKLAEPALVSRTETPDEIMRVAHKQVETSLGRRVTLTKFWIRFTHRKNPIINDASSIRMS